VAVTNKNTPERSPYQGVQKPFEREPGKTRFGPETPSIEKRAEPNGTLYG
jgi:hypothetical protein